MPQTFVIESHAEFVARHGDRPIRMHDRWLLPDGAYFTNNGYGPQPFEPPADLSERARNRVEYHRESVERAEAAFNKLRSALLGEVDNFNLGVTFRWDEQEFGPHPTDLDRHGSPDGIAALTRLQGIVEERRETLRAAEAEFADTPGERRRREVEERKQQAEAERQQRIREINAAVSKITI